MGTRLSHGLMDCASTNAPASVVTAPCGFGVQRGRRCDWSRQCASSRQRGRSHGDATYSRRRTLERGCAGQLFTRVDPDDSRPTSRTHSLHP